MVLAQSRHGVPYHSQGSWNPAQGRAARPEEEVQ